MEPMKPMKPMEPMQPTQGGEAWWPEDLGQPSSSGSQNGLRYAFFADRKRLLVETNGRTRTYDSGDHAISGVSQANGKGGAATFTDRNGEVELSSLTKLD